MIQKIKHRRRKCKQGQCKRLAIANGFCCEHYLNALDRFEERSRKTKVTARSILHKAAYERKFVMGPLIT